MHTVLLCHHKEVPNDVTTTRNNKQVRNNHAIYNMIVSLHNQYIFITDIINNDVSYEYVQNDCASVTLKNVQNANHQS